MSESRDNAASVELERLRRAIDAVDRELLEALNRRAALVQQVGVLKARADLPVLSAARERDLIEALQGANPGPFPAEGVEPVFREIVSATRSLERKLRVAYLGPEGTYAHQAARRQCGSCAAFEPAVTISDVFAGVACGRADLGVVPVENTIQGVVTETLDNLVGTRVAICGEILLPISHQLLSRSGRLEDVRRVASHPQALAQCRGWLSTHLPGVERVEMASTAGAARLAAEDDAVAAIGSAIAAETYGLARAAAAIEDRRGNTTRFLLIGSVEPAPSGRDRTCAVFTLQSRPGALHQLIEPFARHGVNLTAIESRPIPGKHWQYHFYLDMHGHRSDDDVAKALDAAAQNASSHRVLGSFPRALAEEEAP
ncbi:MAG: prephenate dehydratase [Myxococcota bacterium]|nr:prephenate dehydratase [Myxococcota bacterium]